AGETMLEAVDKVAEEHERNVRLALLLLSGLRALDARPADPAAVTESFLLKLLSLSGFHPALTACAGCGSADLRLWAAGLRGAGPPPGADQEAAAGEPSTLALLAHLAPVALSDAGVRLDADERPRRRARSLLFGFAEYHLERRMKSVPMLVRTA